jgi:hypothetical protein
LLSQKSAPKSSNIWPSRPKCVVKAGSCGTMEEGAPAKSSHLSTDSVSHKIRAVQSIQFNCDLRIAFIVESSLAGSGGGSGGGSAEERMFPIATGSFFYLEFLLVLGASFTSLLFSGGLTEPTCNSSTPLLDEDRLGTFIAAEGTPDLVRK